MYSVYFVQQLDSIGLIKIGTSNDVTRRLSDISTGNPCELKLLLQYPCASQKDARGKEKLLHKNFAFCRKKGEWFSPAAQLRQLIGALSIGMDFDSTVEAAYAASKKKIKKYNIRKSILS